MNAPGDRTELGITVKLVGGLGNQLFQYAAARGAAARLECPAFVDIAPLAHIAPPDTPRSFALAWLVDATQIIDSGPLARTSRWTAAARRRLPGLAGGRIFQQQGFTYDPRFTKLQRGAILSGYFQSGDTPAMCSRSCARRSCIACRNLTGTSAPAIDSHRSSRGLLCMCDAATTCKDATPRITDS